jgi:hypothetical protein
MTIVPSSVPAPGWVGGFAQSNPAFAYPKPNLTSLPMRDNMANIALLQRQQEVLWPEFSWETRMGEADPKRCYQMFAPDISRLGYTNAGRVYSIICPQQGVYIKDIGYLNVEVTVTGNRGWADETTKELAADMTVEGKIWFSKSAHQSSAGAKILALIDIFGSDFPGSKAKAMIVTTHKAGDPSQPIFSVTRGETDRFPSPEFAKHPEAWTTGHIEVQIGPIQSTGNAEVDAFNKHVLELFNLGSGNMLQTGNILTWNLWFNAPQIVDQAEWASHAERWRKSIDEDHGSPDGEGSTARYFDGSSFSPIANAVEEVLEKIWDFLKSKK